MSKAPPNLTAEARRVLLQHKRKSIGRLQRQVAELVSSCPHNVIQSPFYKSMYEGEVLRRFDTLIRDGKALYDPKRPLSKDDWAYGRKDTIQFERVWSFGGARCSICDQDFGWYCPLSPSKHCEYEKSDEDNCDYCGMPSERK